MAEPTTDAFLQGQGIPVDPLAIEAELTRLWGPAAERLGGPDLDRPNVTRVALANLVAVEPADPDEAARLDAALDEVAVRFPCRAIVLRRTEEPGRSVSAEVSAVCHLPAPGRPQVCSERIILRAGSGAVDLLPGAVRPLLEADLPVVLWWADDPRRFEAVFRTLAAESSRLVLDLPEPAEPGAVRLGLDPDRNPYARDAAWFGITPWRELVAQFFDPPCHAPSDLARIDSVAVSSQAPALVDGLPPRQAAWLVGWLAGQLGWEPEGDLRHAPGHLEATFRGPSGPIAATLSTEAVPGLVEPRLVGLTLTTRGPEGATIFRLARHEPGSPDIRIAVASPEACALPRAVLAPDLDHARRVAAALESARDDPPFRRALPHALRLLGG